MQKKKGGGVQVEQCFTIMYLILYLSVCDVAQMHPEQDLHRSSFNSMTAENDILASKIS